VEGVGVGPVAVDEPREGGGGLAPVGVLQRDHRAEPGPVAVRYRSDRDALAQPGLDVPVIAHPLGIVLEDRGEQVVLDRLRAPGPLLDLGELPAQVVDGLLLPQGRIEVERDDRDRRRRQHVRRLRAATAEVVLDPVRRSGHRQRQDHRAHDQPGPEWTSAAPVSGGRAVVKQVGRPGLAAVRRGCWRGHATVPSSRGPELFSWRSWSGAGRRSAGCAPMHLRRTPGGS